MFLACVDDLHELKIKEQIITIFSNNFKDRIQVKSRVTRGQTFFFFTSFFQCRCFSFVLVGLSHINLCRLFNTKSIFMQIILFQTIQFRISTQFKCMYSLIVKTFLFQAIQFSQAVLIQFSISTDFVYTQLNVKTFLH